jgi:hypothetical protein
MHTSTCVCLAAACSLAGRCSDFFQLAKADRIRQLVAQLQGAAIKVRTAARRPPSMQLHDKQRAN